MNYMEMSINQLKEYATLTEIRKLLQREEMKELQESIARNEKELEADYKELKEASDFEAVKQLATAMKVRSGILLHDRNRLLKLQETM